MWYELLISEVTLNAALWEDLENIVLAASSALHSDYSCIKGREGTQLEENTEGFGI